jgi:hypothetical protein
MAGDAFSIMNAHSVNAIIYLNQNPQRVTNLVLYKNLKRNLSSLHFLRYLQASYSTNVLCSSLASLLRKEKAFFSKYLICAFLALV